MVRMCAAVGFMMMVFVIPVCVALSGLTPQTRLLQKSHRSRPSTSPFPHLASTLIENSSAAEELGSSTLSKENYDIVNVDLDNGRDYPIYIGTSYSDQEGRQNNTVQVASQPLNVSASFSNTVAL